jgi:hypothetical protein
MRLRVIYLVHLLILLLMIVAVVLATMINQGALFR